LPSTGEILSSALVTAVARQYPGIRVRIVMGYAGTLLRWLETGEVDATLLYGAERSAEIRTVPLVDEPLWVVGPPDSGLRPDEPVPLPVLAGWKLILPSAPHGIRIMVEHACKTAGISLELFAETNALTVQRRLVLDGHGLTILPPIAVADDLAEGRLVGAPISGPGITRTIVLALPANRPTGRHIRGAVDILVDEMRRVIRTGGWPEGRWLADEKPG
jgi:DNA-binding transcriptional LysR family regulator